MALRWLALSSFLALGLAAAPPAAGLAGQERIAASAAGAVQDDAELEARTREIASRLRCPTCRALSVQDSPSGMAQQMQNLIREKLREGATADEVYAYFVDRYGEWILLAPEPAGFNWTVWLLPVFLMAAGLAFVLLTARRWVRQGREREAALIDAGE